MKPLLEVIGLEVFFPSAHGNLRPVAGIGFHLRPGESLGLVGESGCGKTLTALSILRLIPPPGRIARGRVMLEDADLLTLPEKEMIRVRGGKIAMIFQEPMTSLNPVFTIGNQVIEAILAHQRIGVKQARRRAVELLRSVNIPRAEERLGDYPHQFSGGMRQRVMLAMAISCRPLILIADEPTTALDVTVQAQIMSLLSRLRLELRMAMLLVTHDLGIVARSTDRVAVMYLGKIVETCPTPRLFQRPLHPYTRGLLASIPRLGERRKRLKAIAGGVPDPGHLPSGCPFHPRCEIADDACRKIEPALEWKDELHAVSCLKAGKTG